MAAFVSRDYQQQLVSKVLGQGVHSMPRGWSSVALGRQRATRRAETEWGDHRLTAVSSAAAASAAVV